MKRDLISLGLPFADELIIDNFAGGGGTSTGLEAAFGRPVDIAINHDPEALAMHAINHPRTLHLLESVWDVDPIKVTKNQPVGLVWLSPDCKHFSKAKGGTPVAKHIRGLAWVGMRWIARCKPRVMMLENVEEFTTWGPLMLVTVDGKEVWMPDPAKRGKTFDSFVRQLRGHGYKVEWRELRACDNGAPTIRKRLFMVARRDGLPIVWPDATHGDPASPAVLAGKLLPWRSAAECIDFDLPARSVFDRKKALADNTLRRVAKGLWRHVLTSPKPFIVGVGGRMGQSPARGVHQPVQTITSKADSALAAPVLAPVIVGAGGPAYSGKPVPVDRPFGALTTENHRAVAVGALAPLLVTNTTGHRGAAIDQPVPTITTGGQHALTGAALAPFITEHANSSTQRTMAAGEPLRTICTQVKGGHFSVVAPTLHPMRGTEEAHLNGDDIAAPLSTISAGGTHHALSGAHLITIGYGERQGQEPRALDINQPLGTVVAGGVKHAVCEAAFATKFNTGSVGYSLDEPMATIKAGGKPARPSTGITQGLVAAHLVDMGHGESCSTGAKRWSDGARSLDVPLNTITASSVPSAVTAVHLTHLTHHGERAGNDAAEPLRTIIGAHRGEQALVAACLEQANGGFYEGDGRAADAPMSTITAAGSNQRLITAYCVKYYSSGGQWQGLAEPMHTLPTKGRMGLVQVVQVSVDCLAPELRARAKQCAELLHQYLPEHFPEPADLVLVGDWVLVDITLRMLKAPELFRAQSFPRGYVIHEIPNPTLLFAGGMQASEPLLVPRIPLTATAQVRMCGNSVAPAQAEALARANFRHEMRIAGRAAA